MTAKKIKQKTFVTHSGREHYSQYGNCIIWVWQ